MPWSVLFTDNTLHVQHYNILRTLEMEFGKPHTYSWLHVGQYLYVNTIPLIGYAVVRNIVDIPSQSR